MKILYINNLHLELFIMAKNRKRENIETNQQKIFKTSMKKNLIEGH